MSALKQRIVFFIVCLLAILVAFSSHPYIVDISRDAGMEKGSILSRYIVLVFILLFALCFSWSDLIKSKIIRIYSLFLIWIFLFSLITIAFFSDGKLFGEIRSLVICLIALAIGWRLDLDDSKIRNLLLVFSISTLYIGFAQVFTNIGGFVIEDQLLTDNKNALGLMLATSIAIFTFIAVERHSNLILLVFCWIAIVALFALILTIRARTATLVALFSVLLILYRRINKSYFILIVVSIPVLVILGMLLLPTSITDFVTASFFSGYEGGDITSGRFVRNRKALEFLSFHPFLGNLQHKSEDFGWIHNYPLLQLFNNGLVFAFPLLGLYVYLFVFTIKKVFNSKVSNTREVGFFAALVPFIVSFAEPTFPFGPGTATVFNFILLGVAIKQMWMEGNHGWRERKEAAID